MAAKKICTIDAGTILDLRWRRSSWDPKTFPSVAAFATMPKPEQNEVVAVCKRSGGVGGMALELIPRCSIVP